jgi:predicted Zn-dependent peptidase
VAAAVAAVVAVKAAIAATAGRPATAAPTAAVAASAARAVLVTGPAEIADLDHTLSTLPSGVQVVTERVESVRSVAIGALIRAGSSFERPPMAGVSHLLEHMLFRGTRRYGSEEIDQVFDAMGSELDAQTDRETTALSTRVLDRHMERAFDVMGEMLWRPRLQELAAEREVVLEEIAMYEDDPQERIFDVLGEAVFGEHALGRPVIGSAETVAALSERDLRDYHEQRYLPANVVISAAGSVDHERLVELTEGLVPGAVDAGTSEPEARLSGPPPRAARQVRFIAKDTEQYHLCIGGPGIARSDERRFALRVLDVVLGAGPSSRLFQEVRERRGLAYAIFSFSGLYEQTGEIGVYVGTRPENLVETVATIAAELRRFVEHPADADELERARENVKGRMALAMESTGVRMARLGAAVLHDLPLLSLEESMARVDAVGVEDLRQLAGELLDLPSLSVAAIGPDEGALTRALACLEAVAA